MNEIVGEDREPSRAEVDALPGWTLLEFGASWCGYCRALRPHLHEILAALPQVRHLLIEDGRGQPLGRSFQVKLWPTLVLMHDGKVLERLVRPTPAAVRAALETVRGTP